MSPTLNVSWPVLGAAVGATWRKPLLTPPGEAALFIPHISREQWLRAAVSGLWLHIGDQRPSSNPRLFRWSAYILVGERRVWDSNPRGRVNALAVFKTCA
jgi:hypothetical protein